MSGFLVGRPQSQVRTEGPLVGKTDGNDAWQIVKRIRLRGSLGAIDQELTAGNPRHVTVRAHRPGRRALLNERCELSQDRHLESRLLANDADRGVDGLFANVARITRE